VTDACCVHTSLVLVSSVPSVGIYIYILLHRVLLHRVLLHRVLHIELYCFTEYCFILHCFILYFECKCVTTEGPPVRGTIIFFSKMAPFLIVSLPNLLVRFLTPKRFSIFTKNASWSRRYHALHEHNTNNLQPCRSHLTTSTVWTRHMRRPEVHKSVGNPTHGHGAQQWFGDMCTSLMARVQNKRACMRTAITAASAPPMLPNLARLAR
jgi:hypothetical protein